MKESTKKRLAIRSSTKRLKRTVLSHCFPRVNFRFLQQKAVTPKGRLMDANFVEPLRAKEKEKEEKGPSFRSRRGKGAFASTEEQYEQDWNKLLWKRRRRQRKR